jgi:hypothetical protein
MQIPVALTAIVIVVTAVTAVAAVAAIGAVVAKTKQLLAYVLRLVFPHPTAAAQDAQTSFRPPLSQLFG